MSESFLYYIWQFQYFDKKDLVTTQGEPVTIFNPGIRNDHAGPDFSNTHIKIGNMEWVGSVEIHVNASAWLDHNHTKDAAYENVVLHVVWKNDRPIQRNDNTLLPTIELKDRIEDRFLLSYKKLINDPEPIPCSAQFVHINNLTMLSMMDKVLSLRLKRKASEVATLLKRNNNSWEETSYQLLSKNFGFKVNAEPFAQLAHALPYKILLKHTDKLHQIEALLFGQAGFLEEPAGDEYYNLLQREYRILAQKYQLSDHRLNKAQWRFLRLRPSNFPTIRIAQIASLFQVQQNIFSKLTETQSYNDFTKIFAVTQSTYWTRHYQFGKEVEEIIPSLGSMSVDNVLVNTVAPILVAYGKFKDQQEYVDRAVMMLQSISAENNAIIKKWTSLGINVKSAFDSQALIELHNNFCQRRKCLECAVGSSLLKPMPA